MLKWKLFRSKILAISFLIFISVLFFLPGSSLPKNDWLSQIGFDKMVHFGIFATLLFWWRSAFPSPVENYQSVFFLGGCLYGLLVEIVQSQWVPNRSFDVYDVVADILGSLLGLYVWSRVYKK